MGVIWDRYEGLLDCISGVLTPAILTLSMQPSSLYNKHRQTCAWCVKPARTLASTSGASIVANIPVPHS